MARRLITDPKIFHRKLFNLIDIYSSIEQTNIHDLGVDGFAYVYRLRTRVIPNGTLLQIAQLMCKVECANMITTPDGDININVMFELPENE